MTMVLQNPKFAGTSCGAIFEFDVSLKNNEPIEITVDVRGKDLSVSDDQGKPYLVFYKLGERSSVCGEYSSLENLHLIALGPGGNVTLAMRVTGQFDGNIKKYVFTAVKAGRIQNARWEIPVPPR
jgi:hypothetical protein